MFVSSDIYAPLLRKKILVVFQNMKEQNMNIERFETNAYQIFQTNSKSKFTHCLNTAFAIYKLQSLLR